MSPLQTYLVFNELDVCIGSDRIVRINLDGICVMRIRLEPEARVNIRDLDEKTP